MFKDDSLVQTNEALLMEYADTPIGCLTPTLMYQILETHKHYLAIARGSNVPLLVRENIQEQIQHTQDVIDKFEKDGDKYIEAEIILKDDVVVPAPKARRKRPPAPKTLDPEETP
jgi:hypothetical protein